MQLNAEAGLGWHLIDWKGQGFSAVMDAHAPRLRIFFTRVCQQTNLLFLPVFLVLFEIFEGVKGVILHLDK